MKRLTVLGIVGFSLLAGLGLALTAVAFEEPIQTPPDGLIAAPLLAGGQAQTRTGPLTVEGGVTVGASGLFTAQNGVITSGSLTVNGGSLCLQGYCVASWDGLNVGRLVRLLDLDETGDVEFDVGQARVNGSLTVTAADGKDIGLYGRAAAPEAVNDNTFGLEGQSALAIDNDQYSYGVLGIGRNQNFNSGSLAYGVYGSDEGNADAYAGYFSGNVEVTADWGETGSPICLVSDTGQWDCRTAWPEVGSAGELLQLQTTTPPAPQTGQTVVSGRAWFNSSLIGDPDPADYGLAATCGDGVCASPETALTCSPDCPTLFAVSAAWFETNKAKFTWKANVKMTSVAVYGLGTTYGSLAQDTPSVFHDAGAVHTLIVTGVDQTKTLHYRVGGETESGAMLFTVDKRLNPASRAPEPGL